MSLEIFIEKFSLTILSTALWPSAANRDEYQEYFLGVKAAVC
jgi:hypothetical protein